MFPHHYSLIWWVVVYIPHTEITHNKKILILRFVRALYWWLETQSPKFVQTSLQSRLNFFHSCMGISSYKVWWMIFYVIKGSSCETWSGIWAFLAIYYLLGHEGLEILLLLFSSLESHAIVSVVTAITWPWPCFSWCKGSAAIVILFDWN